MDNVTGNDIAQRVANYGASLGLRESRCLVQNVTPDWTITVFCTDPADGKVYCQAKPFEGASLNLAAAIEETGKTLMQSLLAKFHTHH